MPVPGSRRADPAPPPAVPASDPFVRRREWGALDWPAWRAFLTRWAISVCSLAAGLAALFVFRRGVPHVGWIAGYVVVLWLLFTVLTQMRARLPEGSDGRHRPTAVSESAGLTRRDQVLDRGRRLVVVAGDYTIQTLYHGLLLFVLPGYLASTTFDAVTVAFFVVLVAATLLTTVDPWYRALIHPHPWCGRAFFAFSIFAGLNVALPLVGVPPSWALTGSAASAGLALAPAFVERAGSWLGALGYAAGCAVIGAALAWLCLPAIPPAPLQLVTPTIARAVANLEPVDAVGGWISARTLAAWGGLVAYTPVSAPAGLRQPILHEWRHDGRVVTTVRLPTPVLGGRAAGFRTYSRKTDFPPDPRGRWAVDVVTASGQLIGRVRFTVVP